jgi:cytochrome c oxidase cbb3-type subunit III
MSFPFQHQIMKKIMASVFLLLPALTLLAKGGGTAPETTSSTNWLAILLVFVAVILLVVIWGLGQVLLTLNKQLLQKRKGNYAGPLAILILTFISLSDTAQAQTADAAAAVAEIAPNYGGLSQLEFYAIATVIALEIVVILFLAFMVRRSYRELSGTADLALAESVKESRFSVWWSKLDKNIFTRAVPVEQEADVLLDHDYDGIKELDNALPPWWKWGFYFTIIVAVIYIFNYHVFGTGKNPEQEYAAEMAEGKRLEEQYKARTKTLVDENNITLADADGIAAGKALFTTSCVACHMADGGGGIGPNLTDEYWLHGGGLNDIYKTLKIGYPEKGMQSWESMYSPLQLRNLTSFIKSLKGTKPATPKAPQGDLISETTAPAAATVTTPAAKDSVAAK